MAGDGDVMDDEEMPLVPAPKPKARRTASKGTRTLKQAQQQAAAAAKEAEEAAAAAAAGGQEPAPVPPYLIEDPCSICQISTVDCTRTPQGRTGWVHNVCRSAVRVVEYQADMPRKDCAEALNRLRCTDRKN